VHELGTGTAWKRCPVPFSCKWLINDLGRNVIMTLIKTGRMILPIYSSSLMSLRERLPRDKLVCFTTVIGVLAVDSSQTRCQKWVDRIFQTKRSRRLALHPSLRTQLHTWNTHPNRIAQWNKMDTNAFI